ncbi:MAG: hypothetical protein ACYTHN_24995 [Planctomycetota bacterium]|jgi:hypothetical protein
MTNPFVILVFIVVFIAAVGIAAIFVDSMVAVILGLAGLLAVAGWTCLRIRQAETPSWDEIEAMRAERRKNNPGIDDD